MLYITRKTYNDFDVHISERLTSIQGHHSLQCKTQVSPIGSHLYEQNPHLFQDFDSCISILYCKTPNSFLVLSGQMYTFLLVDDHVKLQEVLLTDF